MKRSPMKRGTKGLKRSSFKAKVSIDTKGKKKKVKKKKLPTVKTVKNAIDKLFARLIRERQIATETGCFFCASPVEVSFHVLSRGTSGLTLFDPDNCVGSCKNCNFEEQFRTAKYIHAFISKAGLQKFDDLVKRSKLAVNIGVVDYREMLEALKLKGLDGIACKLAEIRLRALWA